MQGVLSCALRLFAGTIAAPTASAEPVIEAPAAEDEFRDVRVEVVGFDAAELLAALRLRMPRLQVAPHDGAPPSGLVYLQVARDEDGKASLRVITSDGRAFERTLAVDPQNEIRVAASMAANLIFAAEQRTLQPDREHVPIPTASAEQELPLAVPVEPRDEPAPVEPRVESRPPAPRPSRPAPPRERWEWAVSTLGAAALSLGPKRYGELLAGGGAGLGAELRGPRGGALVLELRGLGRRDAPLTIGRLRVGLGGGYVLRRARFELPLTLALAVEPWWIDNTDSEPVLLNGGVEARRRPLFGGYLRASPGLRLGRPRGGFRGVHVGPRIELGGEMLYYDGPVVVGLADGTGTPHFRLGGLELALGVEVAVYLAAPARRAARR